MGDGFWGSFQVRKGGNRKEFREGNVGENEGNRTKWWNMGMFTSRDLRKWNKKTLILSTGGFTISLK